MILQQCVIHMLYYSGFSRETITCVERGLGGETERERECIIGIDSQGYGGWEVLTSVLSYASWRPRKTGGVIQGELKGFRTARRVGSHGVSCSPSPKTLDLRVWCPRAGCTYQLRQGASSLFHLFVLLRPLTDWMMPTHNGKGYFLYSVYWFKC